MTRKIKNHTFFKDLLGGASHSNESGQSELLFILLTFCLLSLMVFFSKRMILHYKMNQQRQKTYLCIKESFEQHIQTKDYIQYINYSIGVAWAAMTAFPQSSLAIERTIKGLRKVQYAILFSSFYSIYTNEKCSLEQKLILISHTPILLNWPKMKIKRKIGGFARFQSKKRVFIFPSKSLTQSDFFIKGEIHYRSQLKLTKTKEYELALLNPINQAALKSRAKSIINQFKNFFKNPADLIGTLLGMAI